MVEEDVCAFLAAGTGQFRQSVRHFPLCFECKMTSTTLQLSSDLRTAARRHLTRAAEHLLSLQEQDGYWCALLTADTTLESDYILLQLWLHPPVPEGENAGKWLSPNRGQINRAADRILSRQLPDGGFNIYVDGPSEISASVKAYFALKLSGISAGDNRLTRLRDRILDLGGLQAANSYTKVNLSLFDLYPREDTPSIPPEILLASRQASLSDVFLDSRYRGVARHRTRARSEAPRAHRIQSR